MPCDKNIDDDKCIEVFTVISQVVDKYNPSHIVIGGGGDFNVVFSISSPKHIFHLILLLILIFINVLIFHIPLYLIHTLFIIMIPLKWISFWFLNHCVLMLLMVPLLTLTYSLIMSSQHRFNRNAEPVLQTVRLLIPQQAVYDDDNDK